ncbi:HlyD family secretion protein [Devosia sp. UYZn731]|uniref:HlyD family type I secretion periplasmic adaptor subunit n=1 Tax=Devosia sp. UYZn731 TaxID=3156345 RepID=UPI0033947217
MALSQGRGRPTAEGAVDTGGLSAPNTRSLRSHSVAAFGVMFLLVGCMGGWAATTSIAGAVIASGVVSVEGGSKRIQHAEGGIVSEILAHNGDMVQAGDVLVRLDGVVAQSELSIVLSQLRDSLARQARLTAESTQSDTIVMPAVAGNWPPDPELSGLLGAQSRLRQSRKASLDGRLDQLQQQIVQQNEQTSGLLVQQDGVRQQLGLLQEDEKRLQNLFAQGLIESSRLNEVMRNRAQMEGELGQTTAQIAEVRSRIAQLEVSRVQTADDFQADVLQDLAKVSQQTSELMQRKVAAEDRLRRLDIRAPIDGMVYMSTVQTVGGIVGSGETIMQIVPGGNQLTFDVRIGPLDIDKVHVGQDVLARLSGLDPRTTPELTAKVNTIAPDLTRDANSGVQFYQVQVGIGPDEPAKLPAGTTLMPGMPAEIFVKIGDRTVLNYLLSPFTDQLGRALRD